jgi:hypothetical protein
MKQLAVRLLVLVGLVLTGCGSNNTNPSDLNGTWNATLMGINNSTVLAFGTSLQVNNNGSVSVLNFEFTTNSPCFLMGETATGSFTLAGNSNGQVNGKFGMIVQSGTPSGNTLTLSGTAAGNAISGTWSLTGSPGCTGSGTFTMTKM